MKLIKILKLMGNNAIIYLIGLIFMSISIKSLDLVQAFLVKDVLDILINSNGSFKELAIKYGIIGISCLILWLIMTYLYTLKSKREYMNLNHTVLNKIFKLPMKFFDNSNSEQILAKIFNDTDKTASVYTTVLKSFIEPLIALIIYIVPMLILSMDLAICLVIVNIFSITISIIFSKILYRASLKQNTANAKMNDEIKNIILGISEIKIFGIRDTIYKKMLARNKEVTTLEQKEASIHAISEAVTALFDLAGSLIFLGIGILFISEGLADITALAGIYILYAKFSNSFMLTWKNLKELLIYVKHSDKTFKFLNSKEERRPQKIKKIETDSLILFDNVDFSYNQRKLLTDLSFKVNDGELVAITGESGSGKSTIAKLLLGFYSPKNGGIYINGKSAHELKLKALRDKIAYIPQNPYIFNATIFNNIACGNRKASRDDVINAARAANAHSFIMSTEKGYDTIIGSSGKSLSPSEKRSIAIARAVLKDAQILLMDGDIEETNSNNQEAFVIESINKLKEDKTLLIITNNKHIINKADKVITL